MTKSFSTIQIICECIWFESLDVRNRIPFQTPGGPLGKVATPQVEASDPRHRSSWLSEESNVCPQVKDALWTGPKVEKLSDLEMGQK